MEFLPDGGQDSANWLAICWSSWRGSGCVTSRTASSPNGGTRASAIRACEVEKSASWRLPENLQLRSGALSKTVSCQKEPHSRFDARADSYRKSVSLSRQRRGGWRPRELLALCSPAVEWSAICVLRPSAIVNTDYGKSVFALSPDTRRCAGALGHGRMNRDRRLQVGCEKRKRGLAMK